MSGTAIARGLLVDHAALTALVPGSRIYVGTIPQGTAAPCIGITSVATSDYRLVTSKRAGSTKVTERVQVSVIASSLPQCRAVMKQVRRACRDFLGSVVTTDETFAGVTCVLDAKGPDFSDETGKCMQSQDLRITFDESNV